MARRAPKSLKREDNAAPASFWGFNVVDSNGIAPESRVSTSNDCYEIAYNLQLDNLARDRRNSRIYKCYKMFAPTDYSVVAKKELMGLSNIPFGQMKYRVDNRKGTFFDMVAERDPAVRITTKFGNPSERRIYSEALSAGWTMILNQWNSYYYNVNQDIEEMSIYGKGFEVAETRDGWFTKSYHNSSILVPDYTYADLSNLGEFVIKRSYTPLELWKKLGQGDEKTATDLGWNFRACIEAMRLYTCNYTNKWTESEWLRNVASGTLNLSRFYNMRINVYEMYVLEYDFSVSKMMVLQNYGPLVGAYDKPGSIKKITEEDYRESTGFLYYKKDWISKEEFKQNQWRDIICPVIDIPGSGLWHEIKGFAESIFTQCRAYDIHMNRVMDGCDMNMRLMLEGGSAEATKKLKQMEWLPWMVLPEDVKPFQHRFELPVERSINVMQYYMGEVDRGTGQTANAGRSSKEKTATESELDAAENAKIRGTELSQFNLCQTEWHRMLFRRFMRTKKGGEGYELKERFISFMEECNVPSEAYEEKNIVDVRSMMLSGAGSISFKLMASERLVALTGMTPANPGQEAAIRDGISAIGGVMNLDTYRPRTKPEEARQYRDIAQENIGFTTPNVLPESLLVEPYDYHVEHFKGHFSDMMQKLDIAEQRIQQNQADAKYLIPLVESFNLEGAHMVAHLEYIARDQTKEKEAKILNQNLNVLQRRVDQVTSIAQEMAQSEQPEQKDEKTAELEFMIAKKGIELESLQKKQDQKLAATAISFEQRNEQKKEQQATTLGITRAKAMTENEIKLQQAEVENEIVRRKSATEETTNGSTAGS